MTEGAEVGGGVSSGNPGTLPEFVAQCYYRYGLFVATHPRKIILLAIATFFIICSPLWYLPLPGYLPQEYATPLDNYSVPAPAPEGGIRLDPSPMPTPLWYQGPPRAYIQQIIVRSGVVPWQDDLKVSDGYRGPLATVFHLAETIGNFQLSTNSSVTLGTECLLIEGVVKKLRAGELLPHYNCLMLSPADLWSRNLQSFVQDRHVLQTVHSLMSSDEGQTNVADILFGVPSRDIGFRKNQPPSRVITYAITIALKDFNDGFVRGLRQELLALYPAFYPVPPGNRSRIPASDITHVYFPSRLSVWEVLIVVFYCCLFCSIYFSILKMEMFKSKFGMAVSVQVTLISSLCLAVGICAYFGLRPLHSKCKFVYPVLAGLIGFENSMVLIRSVLSTPSHLDVKIRMAQGLAREGWSIVKYFVIMITVITVSFFLFIPLVQEMCIYGSMVLLCDMYMQLVFLTSVLSIDLTRYDNTEGERAGRKPSGGGGKSNPLFVYAPSRPLTSRYRLLSSAERSEVIGGSGGNPSLHRRFPIHSPTVSGNNGLIKGPGQDRVALPQAAIDPPHIPKRLRVTYYVASRRIFQRAFLCVFVAWIAWMVYSSGLIDSFTETSADPNRPRDLASIILSLTNRSGLSQVPASHSSSRTNLPEIVSSSYSQSAFSTTASPALHPQDGHIWPGNLLGHNLRRRRTLLHSHWPTLFGYYNISLRGHYLSLLPPVFLSLPVSPEEALAVHNSDDPNSGPWRDGMETQGAVGSADEEWEEGGAFIPSSTEQLVVTAILVIPAVVCIIYTVVMLYSCVCSRNYAEWRSSAFEGRHNVHGQDKAQIIGDAMPLILSGHPQDVECVCTDGALVVSCCLAGVLRVWDPTTGECVALLDRSSSNKRAEFQLGTPDPLDDAYSDYESGSPRSQCDLFSKSRGVAADPSWPNEEDFDISTEESSKSGHKRTLSSSYYHAFPDLTPTIDLHFRSRPTAGADGEVSSAAFNRFEQCYDEHRKLLEDERAYAVLRANRKSSDDFSHSIMRGTKGHRRNVSAGSTYGLASFLTVSPQNVCAPDAVGLSTQIGGVDGEASPVWCLECQDALVVVGCGNGCVEVWDVFGQVLKCMNIDGLGAGVTVMRLSGNQLMVGRLSGAVDMMRLEPVVTGVGSDVNPNSDLSPAPFKRTHSRCNSCDQNISNSLGNGWSPFSYDDSIKLVKYAGTRAHQQPITVMACDGTHLITGSLDHTLKVFNMTDSSAQFTLHGHCGPITSMFIDGGVGGFGGGGDVTVDMVVGAIIGSGSHDGMLCVWELNSGACVYSVQAHDGIVTTLTSTTSYILSLGADEKLRVWERFQGHLLHTIYMGQMYCSNMIMLTNKLLITSRKGSLTVWDITTGHLVRVVRLGDNDGSVFIRHMMAVSDTVVCDYGNQLRVVKLPVAEKED